MADGLNGAPVWQQRAGRREGRALELLHASHDMSRRLCCGRERSGSVKNEKKLTCYEVGRSTTNGRRTDVRTCGAVWVLRLQCRVSQEPEGADSVVGRHDDR